MVHKLQNVLYRHVPTKRFSQVTKSSYEKYIEESSAYSAEVADSTKQGCCGCLFWFIIIIVLLALLL